MVVVFCIHFKGMYYNLKTYFLLITEYTTDSKFKTFIGVSISIQPKCVCLFKVRSRLAKVRLHAQDPYLYASRSLPEPTRTHGKVGYGYTLTSTPFHLCLDQEMLYK